MIVRRPRTILGFVVLAIMIGISRLPHSFYDWLTAAHTEANVPANETQFYEFLDRALRTYFVHYIERSDVIVKTELFSKIPTQTGIAFPKLYAWVEIKDREGKRLSAGAARIQMIEKEQFDVTDYLPVHDIKSRPKDVANVFPSKLADILVSRAQSGEWESN